MKRNSRPKVSVIMTVHNSQKTVGQAIESLLNQTYENLEIILVDDASTDATFSLLKDYAKKDKRIKLLRLRKNHGPTLAANPALKIAKGNYIARMDADDISFTDRIEKQVKFLEKQGDVVILGGQCDLINGRGHIIGEKRFPTDHKEILESIFFRNPIQHPSCMINRKLVPNSYLRYDNSYRLADDLDFYLKIGKFGKFANLPSKILFYRNSFDSHSLKNIKKTFFHTLAVRIKAVLEYGYKPSAKGIFLSFCQLILTLVFPDKWIYNVFSYAMGITKLSLGTANFVYDEIDG